MPSILRKKISEKDKGVRRKENGRGFTLLEVIIAIFVLTVGAGGAFSLIQRTISMASLIQDRLIASYLAQEGIEIVKNIRDNNWLKGVAWDTDLGLGNWEIQYDSQSLIPCGDPCDYSGNLRLLKIGNGFYNYPSGANSKFKRKITISDKTANKFKISIQIFWDEQGQSRNFELSEYVTNWREK